MTSPAAALAAFIAEITEIRAHQGQPAKLIARCGDKVLIKPAGYVAEVESLSVWNTCPLATEDEFRRAEEKMHNGSPR